MAISASLFQKVVLELLTTAAIDLPSDVINNLQEKAVLEDSPLAKKQFESILENCRIASEKRVGVCQDNGLVLLFADVGQACQMEGDFQEAANMAVQDGTKSIPLRENVIHPLTKKNTGTNVGPHLPYIHWRMVPESDYIEVTVAPKGYGAEMRVSQSWVLSSEDVNECVRRLALDAVADAMGEPCPPVIMGIAVGGHFESNMVLAKRALFREPLGKPSDDPHAAKLEKEILEAVNNLKLGPMGFGGNTYALAVHIEVSGAHTAEIPITVAFQCWAHRYSKARIYNNGNVEYLTHPKCNCSSGGLSDE